MKSENFYKNNKCSLLFLLDSRFRGNDENRRASTAPETECFFRTSTGPICTRNATAFTFIYGISDLCVVNVVSNLNEDDLGFNLLINESPVILQLKLRNEQLINCPTLDLFFQLIIESLTGTRVKKSSWNCSESI